MSHSPAGSAFGSGSGSGSGSNPATPEQLDEGSVDLSVMMMMDNDTAVKGNEQEAQGDSNDEEGSDSEEDEDEDEDEADGAAAGVSSLTMSEREILILLAVDKKLASVLDLAATALSSLKLGGAEGTDDATATASNRSNVFEQHASEYFKTLDDIQLSLRNSIHLIRKSRISPRVLSENPPTSSVLRGNPGVAAGALQQGDGDQADPIGRGAKRMETETWRDVVDALMGMLPATETELNPEQEQELQLASGDDDNVQRDQQLDSESGSARSASLS